MQQPTSMSDLFNDRMLNVYGYPDWIVMEKKTQAGRQHLLYRLLINTLAPFPPTWQVPHYMYDTNSNGMDAVLPFAQGIVWQFTQLHEERYYYEILQTSIKLISPVSTQKITEVNETDVTELSGKTFDVQRIDNNKIISTYVGMVRHMSKKKKQKKYQN